MATVTGTAGHDYIHRLGDGKDPPPGIGYSNVTGVTTGNDVIYGLGGADIIWADDGDDLIFGGDGNDIIFQDAGVDKMYGGPGNDSLHVSDIGDTVFEAKNEGFDTVVSWISFSLAGQYVEELYLAGSANLDGTGNSLDNIITGTLGDNTLKGGAGNDVLDGRSGTDVLIGGTGDDTYLVDFSSATVVENDGQGTDQVNSSVGFDLSGQYIERLTLTRSSDINGRGNSLDNILVGNAGDNVLNGRRGSDVLTGGLGDDTFVFRDALRASNIDTITDFSVGADTIQLSRTVFGALAGTGVLSLAQFAANASGTAQDADDRIIYETDTGKLFYDSNGSAAGGSVQFAQLGAGLALTNADFTVVSG